MELKSIESRNAVTRFKNSGSEQFYFFNLVSTELFDIVKFHKLPVLPREVDKFVAVIGRKRVIVQDVNSYRRRSVGVYDCQRSTALSCP